jgi:hypothetical protein
MGGTNRRGIRDNFKTVPRVVPLAAWTSVPYPNPIYVNFSWYK